MGRASFKGLLFVLDHSDLPTFNDCFDTGAEWLLLKASWSLLIVDCTV